MKLVVAALFLLSLVCAPSAHATFELGLYGGYAYPSGSVLDQLSAFAATYGVASTKGGAAGGITLLFGKSKESLGGLDIGSFQVLNFSSSKGSFSESLVPILGLLRFRPSLIFIDLGAGVSGVQDSGDVTYSSKGTDATFMAGLGVSLGDTFGVDVGGRFYYVIDQGGNVKAFMPVAGLHLRF